MSFFFIFFFIEFTIELVVSRVIISGQYLLFKACNSSMSLWCSEMAVWCIVSRVYRLGLGKFDLAAIDCHRQSGMIITLYIDCSFINFPFALSSKQKSWKLVLKRKRWREVHSWVFFLYLFPLCFRFIWLNEKFYFQKEKGGKRKSYRAFFSVTSSFFWASIFRNLFRLLKLI